MTEKNAYKGSKQISSKKVFFLLKQKGKQERKGEETKKYGDRTIANL